MSGKAVGWAMEQRTGSPTTKLVLVKLADNANEWEAWPSLRVICEDTELGESTVRMHLRKLEALGLITGEERFHEGIQLTTLYTLNAQGWVPRHEIKKAEKANRRRGPADGPPGQVVEARGQQETHPGPADGPPPRQGVAPNPYSEPLVEPALTRAREGRDEIWPAFQRWPGRLPPSASEAKTLAALDSIPDTPDLAELVACIDAQGAEYTATNAARGSLGQQPLTAPHNWLSRDRGWEKHLGAVRDRPARIADGIERAQRVMATLGAEIHARLRKARLNEGEIAALDGVQFDHGPPPNFSNLSVHQEGILRKHHPELNEIWPGLAFKAAADRRRA